MSKSKEAYSDLFIKSQQTQKLYEESNERHKKEVGPVLDELEYLKTLVTKLASTDEQTDASAQTQSLQLRMELEMEAAQKNFEAAKETWRKHH